MDSGRRHAKEIKTHKIERRLSQRPLICCMIFVLASTRHKFWRPWKMSSYISVDILFLVFDDFLVNMDYCRHRCVSQYETRSTRLPPPPSAYHVSTCWPYAEVKGSTKRSLLTTNLTVTLICFNDLVKWCCSCRNILKL